MKLQVSLFNSELNITDISSPSISAEIAMKSVLKGDSGKSAYEDWLGKGYTGTVEDFLAWLREPAEDAANDVSELLGPGETYRVVVLNQNTHTFTLDFTVGRNGVINLLNTTPDTTYLNIINVPENQSGKILVNQSGGKVLIPSQTFVQELALPIQQNKVTIINYQNVAGTLYLTQSPVVSDVVYTGPSTITTSLIDKFDGINIDIKWIEPFSNLDDSLNVDGYDMRYSATPVTTETQWLNSVKFTRQPIVVGAGNENKISLKLKPASTYYIYIRTYKNYKGAYFLSQINTPITVTTKTSINPLDGLPKQLFLSKDTSFPKLNKYQIANGVLSTTEYLYDKEYTPVSEEDERPVKTSKILGTTGWEPQKYWEDSLPYYIVFDLGELCIVDSIYLFTKESTDLEVYGSKTEYDEWVNLGRITIAYNAFGIVEIDPQEDNEYRFIKLSWESHQYAKTNPGVDGTPMWSIIKEFQPDLKKYNFFSVYGYQKTNRPAVLLPPLRDYSKKYTIKEALNTNGHFYQDGRLHSMVSGPYVRLFGAFGHFDTNLNDQVNLYQDISEFKFKTENMAWVADNSGNQNNTLRTLLENTYAPFGLKPIITGTDHFRSVQRKTHTTDEFGNKTYTRLGPDTKIVDQNYFERDNPPSPVKGENGTSALFSYTFDPASYKIYAKLAYTIAAKYGPVKLTAQQEELLPIDTTFAGETKTSGLNLLSGVEFGNEENRTWSGWEAYQQPEEAAALMSAVYDGNNGQFIPQDGQHLSGAKGVSQDFLVIHPGIVGIDKNYLYHQNSTSKKLRQSTTIPIDLYSIHIYSSTLGTEQTVTSTNARGLPLDMQTQIFDSAKELAEYRNRYTPDKEIWITEFGYGEAGAYNTGSKYAAYSLPGKIQDGYLIPDLHRSEVKAAWSIRSIIQCFMWGFNALHYYSTENEGNWFDTTQYGRGAGYEMFEWDKITSTTPGEKVTQTNQYMIPFTRGGFAAMGLFGSILSNGGYPVARGTWLYMTFRNRLSDYYFTGIQEDVDKPDLRIACFSHKHEDKSAFVIYRVGNTNSCYTNVYVNIPTSATKVEKVEYYIPKLPDPRDIPYSLTFGLDQGRTGLNTSTRTYNEDKTIATVTFPTHAENPYYPIVGPVATAGVFAKFPSEEIVGWKTITASQYVTGDGILVNSAALAYRQTEAICDYIKYHEEGIKGANGILEQIPIFQNKIKINTVTEVPVIYLVEGDTIKPTYFSYITDLSAVPNNSNTVTIYWNNTNEKDDSYDLYTSESPEGGYTFSSTFSVGPKNEFVLTDLLPGQTIYVKLQPRQGDQLGLMSDYVSVKTFDQVEVPQNVVAVGVNTSSIHISFDSVYSDQIEPGFLYYLIERKKTNGSIDSFKVENDEVTFFLDSSVQTGTDYLYRVKVVTYGGSSDWTEYVTGRSLTPQETPPTALRAETDILANVIYITFDVELSSQFSSSAHTYFSLTENGNSRVLTNVALSEVSQNILILTYYPGVISTFDENLPLRLSYEKPNDIEDCIKTSFGIPLLTFSDTVVKNNLGNEGNLINTYRVNFDKPGSIVVNEGWNKIIPPSPPTAVSVPILNTEGIDTGILFNIKSGQATIDGVTYNWSLSQSTIENGMYVLTDPEIPMSVYKTYAATPWFATNQKLYYSWMTLSGLSDNNKYTLKLYSSKPVYQKPNLGASFSVNGVPSGTILYSTNNDTYITYTDVSPIDGVIDIKLYCENETQGEAAPFNFFIMEEYSFGAPLQQGVVFIQGVDQENN